MEKELTRKGARLHFGRVILTGCILRPDFDWGKIKEARLIEEVLNHYGTKDWVVPLAQATICDSGPSGRRGFDGREVINVQAKGCGHSDLFSITDFANESGFFSRNARGAGAVTHLEHAYTRYWKPFLTLPREELGQEPFHVPGTDVAGHERAEAFLGEVVDDVEDPQRLAVRRPHRDEVQGPDVVREHGRQVPDRVGGLALGVVSDHAFLLASPWAGSRRVGRHRDSHVAEDHRRHASAARSRRESGLRKASRGRGQGRSQVR